MGGSAAVVAGTGAALAACSSPAAGGTAANTEGTVVGSGAIKWVEETEVIIIGTGIAGLAVGMPLVLAGKKVTFIEKLAAYGGESVLSCGFMNFSGTKWQQDNGIKGTVDEAWEASKDRLSTSELYKE
jgi:fumarate reductase flavoprotein subunit